MNSLTFWVLLTTTMVLTYQTLFISLAQQQLHMITVGLSVAQSTDTERRVDHT